MKPKRTPKMSGLVVAALRNLRDAHGSTAKEIMKYIMAEYNASEAVVQRQLKTALKRGVEYGILKRSNTGYSLNTDAEVIGPLDFTQMDACPKKKRKGCPRKKKPRCKKRKKRRKNMCNVCAERGRQVDCTQPLKMPRVSTPPVDDDASAVSDKRSAAGSEANSTRSPSPRRSPRSRSQSAAGRSAKYSDSEDDDNGNLDD